MRKFWMVILGCFCFFDSYSQIAPPVIEWKKCLGGTRADYSKSIIRTRDNGWLVVGRSYSNDGNVSGHHGSLDSADAWVVKLNDTGAIQWQKSFGGSREDNFNDVIELSNGDFICVGSTESENGDVSGLHTFTQGGIYYSLADLWIVRLSGAGQLLWSKVYGGTDPENGVAIKKAGDGGFIVAGEAQSNDFDVTGNHGWSDIWVIKIDEGGNKVWQKVYGNYNSQFAKSLAVTSDGNYVIGGYQVYKGFPTFIEPVYSDYRDCSLKITINGDLVWENYTGFNPLVPGRSDYISKIVELPSGAFLSVGHWYYATEHNDAFFLIKKIDKNNGNTIGSLTALTAELFIGTYYPNQTGPNAAVVLSDSTVLSCINGMGISPVYQVIDAHLYRFRSDSIIFQYRKNYGGTSIDLFTGIASLNDTEFAVVGQTKSNDGDASGNHGDFDFWVVKFNAANRIKGNVFVDNNNNSIKEVNEPYYPNVKVETQKNGHTVASSTDSLGRFLNLVDSGGYSTSVKPNTPYYTLVPAARASNFLGYNETDSFLLAMVPIPGKKDLLINCIPLDPTRAGFTFRYKVTYSNIGTEVINNCSVRLIKDFYLQYISSFPAHSSLVGDTITWNIGSLAPLTSSTITVSLRVPAPPAVNIESILSYISLLPITGDETTPNNSLQLFHRVTGSFDPNDKTETNGGIMTLVQVANKEDLHYTIRFQNTGTDTAFNVVIKDTLSSKLDWSSFEMAGSSHPYQLRLGDGILTWTFKDILLPDSNHNEALSHGYLNYRIKPKADLSLGDTIPNAGVIYFDFNGGVKTNTQLTIIKAPLPPQPVVTGLLSAYCSNQGIQIGKIINLPAAGSGIAVTAKLDATSLTIASDSTFSFDVNALSAGNHTIVVSFTNGSGTKTFSQPFSNTLAITPDVNVSANITNVTNLSTPVIITATNATWGGTTPLYTFAKNSTFTTIVQAEGASNVLNLDPATLAIGDNWIYVRMKSNASCITTQNVTDSIKIIRDQATGIMDPDYPGKVINIYPNPFNKQLYISGLSIGKTYTLYLRNLNGQLLHQKRISNRTNAELLLQKEKTGAYLLSVYDEKKKVLLGSVKVIRQ